MSISLVSEKSTDKTRKIAKKTFHEALTGKQNPVHDFRQALDRSHKDLEQRFYQNEDVEKLVHQRAQIVDDAILVAWDHLASNLTKNAALIAVGGYGRGELHPHSDIDLMILLDDIENKKNIDKSISQFLTFLWDIGLEVGHSVRNLQDCETQARLDVTVLTTMMEARLLRGPKKLFEELSGKIDTARMWNSDEFFKAKLDEQIVRHNRYDNTPYNLEPNIKGSPGGLRDIQMISWLARRHLGVTHLDELVGKSLLTPGQLRILSSGKNFLWKIRFCLHLLTGRREDRLLFDYQIKVAKLLGYEDASYTLAVEQFMQRYYRTVMELSRLNEMLWQLLEEVIFLNTDAVVAPMGENFNARNGYLEAANEKIFIKDPSALLEIFLLLEKNLDLKGVDARTIALIKQHLWLIDEEFRQNPRNQRLFLDILRAPQGVTRTLRRMNTYGVLGLYIPAFERIVGRMQYDLFHAYTVDAHTLFVVENLRRFSLERFNEEFPDCSRVMQRLPKPELTYLAGLFHDIAKGRGGDHSELGAVDAEAFCLEHNIGRYDARIVAWLVKNHLLLSLTAQKKDLSDPVVINEFAQAVGDETRLDYLYVLTVADVRGTNPKIWNSWKENLFWELYQLTKQALRHGTTNPIDKEELIKETQITAKLILDQAGVDAKRYQPVWSTFSEEYFLRHRPEEIAWHSRVLTLNKNNNDIQVDINNEVAEGWTAVMIYAPKKLQSFTRITAIMDAMGLNIVDARIVPTTGSGSLDTYFVLENDGSPIEDERRTEEIKSRLLRALTTGNDRAPKIDRRVPRQVRMFSTEIKVNISQDFSNKRTVCELIAGDRPGLLFEVGKIFSAENVKLQNAKIATVGERAEDVFFITNSQNKPLDEQASQDLENTIKATLSNPEIT